MYHYSKLESNKEEEEEYLLARDEDVEVAELLLVLAHLRRQLDRRVPRLHSGVGFTISRVGFRVEVEVSDVGTISGVGFGVEVEVSDVGTQVVSLWCQLLKRLRGTLPMSMVGFLPRKHKKILVAESGREWWLCKREVLSSISACASLSLVNCGAY